MFDKNRVRHNSDAHFQSRRNTPLPVLVCGLIAGAAFAVPARARAQEKLSPVPSPPPVSDFSPGGDANGSPPLPPPSRPARRPKLAITAEQVETFADLLGESEGSVVWRLRHDPGLVPMVAAAADARRTRQRSGRHSMILGFTVVGLGGTVAMLGVFLSEPGYPGESSQPNEQSTRGHSTTDVVGLVLIGLGLVTATYGIIKVAAQTDIETEAAGRYQRSQGEPPQASPPGNARLLPSGSAGKTLSLSLWSFTF